MALIAVYKDTALPYLAPILFVAPPILISSASNPRTSSSMAHPESCPSSLVFGMRKRKAAHEPSIPPLGADGPFLEEVPQMDAQIELDLGPVPAVADERPAWATTAKVHFQAIKVHSRILRRW